MKSNVTDDVQNNFGEQGINNFSVEVSSLSKEVQDAQGVIRIIDDAHFTIKHGESVAITGPSGSGKSTLLGLLAGLDKPTSGKVLIDGTALFDLDEDGRARVRAAKVGFVFQSFELLPNLTALENVMLPLELQNKSAREPAEQMLAKVGLSSRLKHYPATLSGGEQQRVCVARAFVQNPSLILADEPTGSLDTLTGGKIIELMFEMHRSRTSTLILVTHDLNLARRCDRQLTLENGRLVH